jgi:hypothetical protein
LEGRVNPPSDRLNACAGRLSAEQRISRSDALMDCHAMIAAYGLH